jgi:hypothetical protein
MDDGELVWLENGAGDIRDLLEDENSGLDALQALEDAAAAIPETDAEDSDEGGNNELPIASQQRQQICEEGLDEEEEEEGEQEEFRSEVEGWGAAAEGIEHELYLSQALPPVELIGSAWDETVANLGTLIDILEPERIRI